MSMLTDVKRRILELEGGAFQEFCDALLVRKGYERILELGMQSGTMKTTIGNPDTYFRSISGKYIFVAYTTHQNNIFGKIKEDIDKCLDKEKIGIEISDIEEIVYCHTSSNLTVGQDKQLHELCEEKGILLDLYGVDRIANEVYFSYKTLAKDMLGLSIDTNQIFDSGEFVLQYDSNEMAAPISTVFQFRENESKDILTALDVNKVVAVYGKAGAGKTRLAIEVVKRYQEDNNYMLYCIKSNNLSIAQDLAGYLSKPGKYLIFVDDANELIGLRYVLDYLNKKHLGFDVKIIVTVRDYARQKVLQEICDYTKPYTIEISRFTDQEVEQFLDTNMGIRNEDYVSQIIRLAEGNPRIAYMAGKLAIAEQKLSAIQDATQLYENYYNKYISNSLIAKDRKLCLSAGIISLLHTINLDKIDMLKGVFDIAGITEEEFCNYIYDLHAMELVEVKYDKVARITDQCLANYMLYYTFFIKRYVPFSLVLDIGFKNFKNGILKATSILWNIFCSDDVHEYLEKEINKVWDKYCLESEVLYGEFIKVFHEFRPEEALLFVQSRIQKVEKVEIDINAVDFSKNVYGVKDDILLLLSGYRYSKLLSEALELIFTYATKKLDIIVEIFDFLKTYYSIDKYSERYDYYTEKALVKELIKHTDNVSICKLFIHMAKHLLSLIFTPSESGRGNTFIMYRIPVKCTDGAKEFRKLIWEKLIELNSKTEWQKELYTILTDYSHGWGDEIDSSILSFDMLYIAEMIHNVSSGNAFCKVKICSQLIEKCKRCKVELKINFDNIFNSYEWRIYSILTEKYYGEDYDYIEGERLRKEEIKKYADTVDNANIEKIIILTNEMVQQLSSEDWTINEGLYIFAESLFENYERLMHFVISYFKYGEKLSLYPLNIIKKLMEYLEYKEIYDLISCTELKQINLWQFSFFEALPDNAVNEEYLSELLHFLRFETDRDIQKSSYKSLRLLDKFLVINKDIYCDASRIIYEKIKYSKFIVHIYFGLLFNEHVYKPEELLKLFVSDIGLLKNIYFEMLQYDSHNDYSGKFIKAFIETDGSWLVRYSNYIYDNLDNHNIDVNDRLNACWDCENYIEIFDYVFTHVTVTDESYIWKSKYAIRNLLLHKENEQEKANRQREWVFHLITENYSSDRIFIIFEILSELGEKIRRNCIALFVTLNQDYETFRKLRLEPNHWDGSGSMIPCMQQRVEYYKSLLPYFTGIILMHHKKLIKEYIKSWEKRIEQEQVDEILEELYK